VDRINRADAEALIAQAADDAVVTGFVAPSRAITEDTKAAAVPDRQRACV